MQFAICVNMATDDDSNNHDSCYLQSFGSPPETAKFTDTQQQNVGQSQQSVRVSCVEISTAELVECAAYDIMFHSSANRFIDSRKWNVT